MLPAKQHINLQIGAHNVSLDVPREAEPLYRKAAVTLNERFQYYQRRMLKASAEQLWLYVALELAVNLHADAREKSLKPIQEKIEVLNQLIENCLQKENALLREDLQEQRQEIIRSHSELQELQKQCRLLSTANAIGGDAATRENAYRRLSYIIAQIDKAIAALANESLTTNH